MRVDVGVALPGRTRPRLGICLHVALSARPAAGLADMTAGFMQAMYGVPADRARQLAIAGTPSQVATHLARYFRRRSTAASGHLRPCSLG